MLTERHRPQRFSDLIGNPDAIERVRQWAARWSGGKKQVPLLLYGRPGCGKTSLAHVVALEMDWEILETNASDLRSKTALTTVISAASTESTLSGNRRLLIIDEVDGIDATDRGAVTVITETIEKSTQPIILIANDAYTKKLEPLRTTTTFIEMKGVNTLALTLHLKKVSDKEKLSFDDATLRDIADKSKGDVRSAMVDLQGNPSFRDRKSDIFKALSIMFKSDNFNSARASMWDVDTDPEMIMQWVDENIPNEYEKPADISRAFEALSRADVMEGRIHRRQYWGLRRYSSDLTTAGVSGAKDAKYTKFTSYKFPSYIKKMSQTIASRAMLKNICTKVGHRLHMSRADVRQQLHFIAPFAVKNAEYYGLEDAEVTLLQRFSFTSNTPISGGRMIQSADRKSR